MSKIPTMNTPTLTAVLLASLGSLVALSSVGQDGEAAPLEFPDASPAATLTQRVGVTDVEVSYNRPSMNGRKIFGGLQPFGEIWRAGANAATKVTFSGDVVFGGAEVPAGSYSLFAMPGQDEWTVILNTVADQSGAYGYKKSEDQVRVQVKPMTLSQPVETLAIGFMDFASGAATLYLEWETTRVPVRIDTKIAESMGPRIEAAMAADGEHPYFAAAMFYYDNDLDMDKAAAWIDEAVKANPQAFWISYRKGLILEKKGDNAGAIMAAKASLAQAQKASGAVKIEYVRLNETLIARCK
ncbi:MAG: hypothetical protein ACI80K_004923 [Paracoccaceae bacterium]|jgi:hypothetical protein